MDINELDINYKKESVTKDTNTVKNNNNNENEDLIRKKNKKLNNSPYKYFFHKVIYNSVQKLIKEYPNNQLDSLYNFFSFPYILLKLSRHKYGYKSVMQFLSKIKKNYNEKKVKIIMKIINYETTNFIRFESSVLILHKVLHDYCHENFPIIEDIFASLIERFEIICVSKESYTIAHEIINLCLKLDKRLYSNSISKFKYTNILINKITNNISDIIKSNYGCEVILKLFASFPYECSSLIVHAIASIDINYLISVNKTNIVGNKNLNTVNIKNDNEHKKIDSCYAINNQIYNKSKYKNSTNNIKENYFIKIIMIKITQEYLNVSLSYSYKYIYK